SSVQSMLVPGIDRDVAMLMDEKSLLAYILEQVVIVQTISFLPGRSVYIRVVQEEDNFFFFHNDLSCSEYDSHCLFRSVVLEAPPIPVLHFQMEGRLYPSISRYPRTLSMTLVNFVNRGID